MTTITTHPFDNDKLHEECGIFGVWGHRNAPEVTALGLHALQHRGQEATGIVAFDGEKFTAHRALGHVDDAFGKPEVMARLVGKAAIGHNRYSTTGETWLRNVQPLFADLSFGGFAIAHNGNLTNALTLRRELVRKGALFQSTTDTEVIVHLMALSPGGTVLERLINALNRVEGAYALVALADDVVIGVRDPLGVRPLVLGKLDSGYVLASESCALDIIGAELVREIEPGEMVTLDRNGVQSMRPFRPQQPRFCIFEYVYFSRPDSVTEGRSIYEVRRRIGAELAREAPPPENAGNDKGGSLVVPVPDSGVPAAIGYASESGLPFELGIIRNHYVGRTFIEPTDTIRNLSVRMKHNPNRSLLNGRDIILVDDSIVRGTTSKKIVEMLRNAGARSVHMRISSPPTRHSCFYGIDTPDQSDLLAHRHPVEAMRDYIGVDSLAFLSVDGLYRAVSGGGRNAEERRYCDACFTGEYPIALVDMQEEGKGAQIERLTSLTEKRAHK